MSTITYTGRLVTTSCWCGIHLAVPEDLYDIARKKKGKAIYCPIGHSFIFSNTVEEELEQARKEIRQAWRSVDATRDLLRHEERSHAATKGHATRLKKRVAAGICPCCKRTFKDLARHMEGQHPDFSVT